MLVQLLGSFAEFERASLLDRVGAGIERKAARGEWTGGTPPYGYRKTRGTTILQPDPATTPLVVAIFRRYVETREGARQIAAWLDGQGVRTRTGGRWSTSSVLAVLRNRTYIGEVELPGRLGAGSARADRRARPLRRGGGDPRCARRRLGPAAHQPLGLSPPDAPLRVRPLRPSHGRRQRPRSRRRALRLLHLCEPGETGTRRLRPGAPARRRDGSRDPRPDDRGLRRHGARGRRARRGGVGRTGHPGRGRAGAGGTEASQANSTLGRARRGSPSCKRSLRRSRPA